MLNRMKFFMVSLVILLGVLAPQTTLAAPSDIKVFLDGQEIVYDVPPQIISSRTMVPLSLTIQAITGSPAGWDGDTKTVTFYAGGHTNIHKIGEKIVYVDGSPVTFDTPSMIIDSRTLVPIRMIAETSGCTVDWDGAKRYVIITSPPSAPPVAETPKILDYKVPTGTDLEKGSALYVDVTTNGAALWVWAEGPGSEKWQGELIDAGNENGRPVWEVVCHPQTSGNIRIYAGKDKTTAGADVKTIGVTVTEPVQEPSRILDYTIPNGTTIVIGSELKVNVTTNGTTRSVWIEGSNGENWPAKLVDNGNADGRPKWEVRCYPTDSGRLTIYANKNGSHSGAARETEYVTVTEKVTETPKAPETKKVEAPKILGFTTDPSDRVLEDGDDEFTIVVTVNSSVKNVWVEDPNDITWQGKITDNGNATGKPQWTIVCTRPIYTGRLFIYADNDDPSANAAMQFVDIEVNE